MNRKTSFVTDGPFLFVNTATGRFVHRSLALLRDRDYVFITSIAGGLLVLAAREPPHAVSVLNPFTGSLIRFEAPLPSEAPPWPRLAADVVGSSQTLILVSVARDLVYWAEPQSESFFVEKRLHDYPASRLPQIAAAGICAAVNRESVTAAKNIFDQRRLEEAQGCRCYVVVVAGGDMLAVLKRRRGMRIFKIDTAGNMMEMVKSIGSQALFLGVRCLVVDTNFFPTVEANCAYFQITDDCDHGQRYIYKFSIGNYDDEQEPELVSAPMVGNLGPLTLTQLLCNYTMDIPGHPLMLKTSRCSSYIDFDEHYMDFERYPDPNDIDHYEEYIDYVEFVDESNDDYSEYYQPNVVDNWYSDYDFY